MKNGKMKGVLSLNMFISDEARKWFEEELMLEQGDSLRFFVKYGGCSSVQQGFSLGIHKEAPKDPTLSVEINGITYFIEHVDAWYLDDHDLYVNYDHDLEEPAYEYKKTS